MIIENNLKNIKFINKSKDIHNNLYDYSLVNYVGCNVHVLIGCSYHGFFKQKPSIHLQGSGCLICGFKKRNEKNRNNLKMFIEKAKLIHGEKYDYNQVIYINSHKNINIVCSKHGKFQQKPYKHLSGRGCPVCGRISKWLNVDILKFRFKKIHNDSYDYEWGSYSGTTHNMNIFCKTHKIWFKQQPHSHLKGYGCPICKKSNGELKIRNWLENKNIEYEINKTFKTCRNIKVLPFDFYLPEHNLLIEYDGEQHMRPKNFGGISKEKADEKFKKQQLRDKIKNDFSINEKIKLIRISYRENIIEKLKFLIT